MSEICGNSNMVNDKQSGVQLHDVSDTLGAAYVDNFGIGGHDAETVNTLLRTAIKKFSSIGFNIHEVEWASTSASFIGLEI
eukprot:5742608-Karenia_brevis.AAC.1